MIDFDTEVLYYLYRYSFIEYSEPPLIVRTVVSFKPSQDGHYEYREVGREWVHTGEAEARGKNLFLTGVEQNEHERIYMALYGSDVRKPIFHGIRMSTSQVPEQAPTAGKVLLLPTDVPSKHGIDLWSSTNIVERNVVEKIRTRELAAHFYAPFDINNEIVNSISNRILSDYGLLQALPSALHPFVQDEYRKHEERQRVFVAHGHDSGKREAVARLVEKLGLEPVLLQERPSRGRTIIEKLEHYSDVDSAIIILTPDDRCEDDDGVVMRARQNVIFELGYFLSHLGRNHVCALYAGSVDIPSNYKGVAWVPLDEDGAWKLQLGKELKSMNIDVDLNKIP